MEESRIMEGEVRANFITRERVVKELKTIVKSE